MCMACEMEAMWFAAMEARAAAVPALLPLPEGGRVGEGGVGGWRGARGESTAPLPNPPPEEGGGGPAPPTFACEETQAE
jgi:hypothetical protein